MVARGRILVIDDEPGLTVGLARLLEGEGYEVETAASAEEGLGILETRGADLVLTDVRMAGMDGLTLLRRVKEKWAEIPVIVVTAYSAVEDAVSAMKAGAFHYLSKPYRADEVRLLVARALDQARATARSRGTLRALGNHIIPGTVVAESPAFRETLSRAERGAASEAPMLIQGETGTGKEVVAWTVHRASPRRDGPFIPVNCAALPESVAEGELFGNVRGAFTGATSDREGLIEGADGGTLFLDEVGDLVGVLQPKLLRAIESGEIRRLGDTRVRRVDVRIIAATTRDLHHFADEGRFRSDLLYRLAGIVIRIPPLRERPEDVVALADGFLAASARHLGKPVRGMTAGVRRLLATYGWPGNVRELRNAIEYAVLMARGAEVTEAELPETMRRPRSTGPVDLRPLEEIERRHILGVLAAMGGHQGRCAGTLGISRRTLVRRLAAFRQEGLMPSSGGGASADGGRGGA